MKLLIALALLVVPLAAQTPEAGEIRRLGENFQFTEGPAWWHSEGTLLFSDVSANSLFVYRPETGVQSYAKDSGGANGNAFDSRGRLYTCEGSRRRVVRRDTEGKAEVIVSEFEGKRLNSPNDIVVRKDGHAYFTDPAFGSGDKERELPFYGVYHIDTRDRLEAIARPQGRPNGIGLSPDGSLLYVTNSDEKNVRVYDLDSGGRATNERVLISGIEGLPDGMTVDSEGNLYIAANGILIYSSDGRFLRKIALDETPSNCAFGGNDLQSLFVTARRSVYQIHLRVKGSLPYK